MGHAAKRHVPARSEQKPIFNHQQHATIVRGGRLRYKRNKQRIARKRKHKMKVLRCATRASVSFISGKFHSGNRRKKGTQRHLEGDEALVSGDDVVTADDRGGGGG